MLRHVCVIEKDVNDLEIFFINKIVTKVISAENCKDI